MKVLTVLQRPVITEKSTLLQERNKYVFQVTQASNKPQIREAVERAFEVKVVSVNIARTRGEMHRLANGRLVKRTGIKKAVVTIRPGDTIRIFEGA